MLAFLPAKMVGRGDNTGWSYKWKFTDVTNITVTLGCK